jgi:iron(III) transport system ATP-binding protein
MESSGDVENGMAAAVRDVEFLGSYVRVHLDTGLPEQQAMIADVSLQHMRVLEIAPGDRLSITLPPDRLRVYPAEQ